MNSQKMILLIVAVLFASVMVSGCQGSFGHRVSVRYEQGMVNHSSSSTVALSETSDRGYYVKPGYEMSNCNLYIYVR